MDTNTVKRLLLDAGTRGPDGAEGLIAFFDQQSLDSQQQFCTALSHATQSLLSDGSLAANARDLAVDNAAHVLHHVQQTVQVSHPDEPLRKACLDWIEKYPRTNQSSWFAYGCVLRLLRLNGGYADSNDWKTEFKFWVQQFTESPEHFSLICRCIMQAIRALGASNSLNSTHLSSLFAHGLRAKNFPVHEVYAALEEISREFSRQPDMTSERGKESQFNAVLRAVDAASSFDAMPQPIAPANFAQKDKTLRSWRVNGLGLPAMALAAAASLPAVSRRPVTEMSYG